MPTFEHATPVANGGVAVVAAMQGILERLPAGGSGELAHRVITQNLSVPVRPEVDVSPIESRPLVPTLGADPFGRKDLGVECRPRGRVLKQITLCC